MFGERGLAVRIVERVAGHYEVQEVEFGKVYLWCLAGVVVECECGERSTFKSSDLLSGSVTICECGKDHTSGIREELRDEVGGHLFKDDEVVHPWRYWHTSEETGLPF
jgi:hypothetical protein